MTPYKIKHIVISPEKEDVLQNTGLLIVLKCMMENYLKLLNNFHRKGIEVTNLVFECYIVLKTDFNGNLHRRLIGI